VPQRFDDARNKLSPDCRFVRPAGAIVAWLQQCLSVCRVELIDGTAQNVVNQFGMSQRLVHSLLVSENGDTGKVSNRRNFA
jgi:hypothetical protein